MHIDLRSAAAIAPIVAQHIAESMFEAHRGAFPFGEPGIVVVFGNDGHSTDIRGKREVESVRQCLGTLGAEELAFATNEDGYTWVILAALPDADVQKATKHLEKAAWDGWIGGQEGSPGCFEGCQSSIATEVMRREGPVTTWPEFSAQLVG